MCRRPTGRAGAVFHRAVRGAALFIATDLTAVGADPDGDEVLEVRHVPLAAALSMVDEGEITDALTVIALLRLDRLRSSS